MRLLTGLKWLLTRSSSWVVWRRFSRGVSSMLSLVVMSNHENYFVSTFSNTQLINRVCQVKRLPAQEHSFRLQSLPWLHYVSVPLLCPAVQIRVYRTFPPSKRLPFNTPHLRSRIFQQAMNFKACSTLTTLLRPSRCYPFDPSFRLL
jgi:hypothetical protein